MDQTAAVRGELGVGVKLGLRVRVRRILNVFAGIEPRDGLM